MCCARKYCRNMVVSQCECCWPVHSSVILDCDLREMTFTSIMTICYLDTNGTREKERKKNRHTHRPVSVCLSGWR